MGIKRLLMTSFAGVVMLGGAFGPLPGATDDPAAMGVALGTVLEANGCIEPTVEAPPAAQFPDWGATRLLGGDVPPARLVRDPFATFHTVAVDPANDVVVMTDSNRHGVWVYDRTAGSPDSPEMTQPRNSFRGPSTGMMFVAMVALDPVRREIYTVDNDIGDRMMTYRTTRTATPGRSGRCPCRTRPGGSPLARPARKSRSRSRAAGRSWSTSSGPRASTSPCGPSGA